MKYKIIEAGTCPKCFSNDIEFNSASLIHYDSSYQNKCNNCGFVYYECYSIEFVGIVDSNDDFFPAD